MIATVTLNPCLDKTITVENLIIDEINRRTDYRRDPGGKGINVSRVVHELGGETIAYGFVGGIDGEILMSLLKQQGVTYDFTVIKGEIRSNLIVTNLKTRHQTRIDAPGPVISADELDSLKNKIGRLQPKPDFLVVGGSVPPGVPVEIYRDLIQCVKKQGIKTVLDSDEGWLREGIKAVPNVVKPNVHEAGKLLGMKLDSEGSVVKAVKILINQGIEIVAISRGREGMIIANKEVMLNVIPPKLVTASTVGAGDSTVGGLVFKLSQGASLLEASRLAVAAGAAAVLSPGTELCHLQDVERLLPLVTVRKI